MEVWVLFHVKMEGMGVSPVRTWKAPSSSDFGTVTLQWRVVPAVTVRLICLSAWLKSKPSSVQFGAYTCTG